MITASHNPAADNGVKLIDPRGEMLEASWETYATKVCNAASSDELVEVLQHLVQSLHIDLSVKPRVIFGRDTRPSGEELSTALAKGLGAMGLSEETIGYGKGEQAGTSDKGVVTTPILHYLVRCENTVGKGELEAYGTPTIQGYYEKMANAFKKLTVRSLLACCSPIRGVMADARTRLAHNRTQKLLSPPLSRSTAPTESVRPSSSSFPRSSLARRQSLPTATRPLDHHPSCSCPSRRPSRTLRS